MGGTWKEVYFPVTRVVIWGGRELRWGPWELGNRAKDVG